MVPILSQVTQIRTMTSYFLKYFLILFTHLRPSLLRGLFLSGFPMNILYAYLFLHSCYMPCPSHPPQLDHSNYTRRRVQVRKLLVMKFSPISRDSSFFSPIFFSTPCSQTPSVYVPPLMSETKFHADTKLQPRLQLCAL
jgi:hypothetical protein